jgi:hypothetical protein
MQIGSQQNMIQFCLFFVSLRYTRKTGSMQHYRRNGELNVVYRKEFHAICDGMSQMVLNPF